MTIGERLRVAREAAGMTQGMMAQAIGRTQGHVTRIENGERPPTYENVERWIAACGVDPMKFHDRTTWEQAELMRARYEAEMENLYASILLAANGDEAAYSGPHASPAPEPHVPAPAPEHAAGPRPRKPHASQPWRELVAAGAG